MKLPALVNRLSERLDAPTSLDRIRRLDLVVAKLPVEPFYEPVSVVEQDAKGRGRHLNLDPPMLNAWAKHMSYSMRARLRSFEPAVLSELLDGTTIAASTLLRAHLEASAMAALSVKRLNEAREPEGLERLADFIPQALFGTALHNKAKKDERVQAMLAFAEQATITVTAAIEALDAFAYGEYANGSTMILYALLCESSHPNQRGTLAFASSREVKPEGWEIRYSEEEAFSPETAIGILNGLARSMSGGYAAVEMLRVASFAPGPQPYRGMPLDETRRIWSAFLARDP